MQGGDPDGAFGLTFPPCQRCLALCEIYYDVDAYFLKIAEVNGAPAVEILDP